MIDNPELQELYGLIYTAVDGYNKTHDCQVEYVDFKVGIPVSDSLSENEQKFDPYEGSVIVPLYQVNVIDYHYRDLCEDDFDWFGPEDWEFPDRSKEVERIRAANRKEAQRRHREGTLKYAPWLHRPQPNPGWEVFKCL